MDCPACQEENPAGALTCAACGQALSSVPEIRPGFVLASRYAIQKTIGKGGMGVVYRAHDRLLDETVAIKVLRPEFAETPKAAQRFISEIKLARAVSHKSVCRIHEYGEDRGIRYVSMAFVDGVDLKRTLNERGPLPPAQAFEVAIRVAEGLQAIHEEGIIHRDLKSNNIMMDARGGVRLMDFGIAKHESSQSAPGMTATGHIVGTPEYMSPEQVRGEKLDFRSDLYSLGIVIYELFTARTPFRGDTPVAIILKQLQDPPPLQGADSAGLPPPVIPVLARVLAKGRDERYESARALARALEEARDAWRAIVPTMVPELPRTSEASGGATQTTVRPTPLATTPPAAARPLPRPRPVPGPPMAPVPRPAPTPTGPSRALVAALVAGALALAVAGWGVLRFRAPSGPGPTPQSTPAPTASSPSTAPAAAAVVPSPSTNPSDLAPPSVPSPASVAAAPSVAPREAERRPSVRAAESSRPAPPPRPLTSPTPPAAEAARSEPRRGAQPSGHIDAMLAEAERTLEAQRYDAAIAAYDEVLKLDPGNEIARMGRATAVNARVTARAMGGSALAPAKKLVPGRTRADSADRRNADKSLSEAFDTSGVEVTRDTQAAALPGRIEFKLEPEAVKAGDRYSIAISLFNTGTAPIEIRDVVVTTTVDDRRASGPVPFQTRVVGPGQRGLLLSLSDFWMENLRRWALEVVVRTSNGEVYRNDLTWK